MNKDVSFRDAIFGVVAGLGLLLAPLCFAHAEEDADAQPAAAPGTQVVDANGTIVGTLIGQGNVKRKSHGSWISINGTNNILSPNGFLNFPQAGGGITFYFTSNNCTGTNYLYGNYILYNSDLLVVCFPSVRRQPCRFSIIQFSKTRKPPAGGLKTCYGRKVLSARIAG